MCIRDREEVVPEPEQLTAANFVDQLRAPIGLTLDTKGQLWVTEAGTGKNDGSIVMITPQGTKTTAMTGFPSVIANGAIEGMSHPLFHDGKLYVLHGVSGMLYTIDVTSVSYTHLDVYKRQLYYLEGQGFFKKSIINI